MGVTGEIRLARAGGPDGRWGPGHWRTADDRFVLTREDGRWRIAPVAATDDLLIRHGLSETSFRTRREALEQLQGALGVEDERLEIAESVLTYSPDALTEYADGAHRPSCWCDDVLVVGVVGAYRRADMIAWVDRALARLRGVDEASPDDDDDDDDDDDELLERALQALDPPPNLIRELDYGRADLRELACELAGWARGEANEALRRHLLGASQHLDAAVDKMDARGERETADGRGGEDASAAAVDPSRLREWVEHPDRLPDEVKLRVAVDHIDGLDEVFGCLVDGILIIQDENFVGGEVYFHDRADIIDWVDSALGALRERAEGDLDSGDLRDAMSDSAWPPAISYVGLLDARMREIATGLAARARQETNGAAKQHLLTAADQVAATQPPEDQASAPTDG
jgi:hypothetical protein